MEREMGELSKIEVEAEDRLTEKQKLEIREQKARLDREFGDMLGKIADRREKLKVHEDKLQHIDRKRIKKEEQLHDLERKLVVLLEEQQNQLHQIKLKQEEIGTQLLTGDGGTLPVNKNTGITRTANGQIVPLNRGSGGGGGGGGGWQGPSPEQKQEAANLMQSTEALMKFGFMSMSLTMFSSLNMIKAMKSVNAMDTVLAGAKNNTNTLTQPNLFKPPPKAGEIPGDEQLTVSAWSVEDVGKWLTALSLGQYRECFADSAVDGAFLYNLDESDLHNTMGIEHKLHRKKILTSIAKLQQAEALQEEKKRQHLASLGITNPNALPRQLRADITPTGALATAAAAGPSTTTPSTAAPSSDAPVDLITLDPDELFSWARHGKFGKISQTFGVFPRIRFDRNNVRRPFLEDFGTQYSEEYMLTRNVNMVDGAGNTLFVVACQNGHQKMPQLLLEVGANPNHQNNLGNTALHYAMTYGFYELGSWLVDAEIGAGADDTLLNVHGLGVYDGLEPS